MGRRLLAGDRMWVDLVEVNPPLIVWISTATAWLARSFGVDALTLYRGLVIAAGTLSIATTVAIMRRVRNGAGAAVVAYAGMFALLALPGYDFGQREHLLVVLVLPYLVGSALELEGRQRPGGWGRAVAAAAGFALKPSFLLAWVAIECAVVWRRRRPVLRLELVLIPAILALYGCAVLLLSPGYLPAVLPLWRDYAAFNHEPFGGVFAAGAAPWIALGSILALILGRRGRKLSALAFLAATGSAALVVSAFAQSKGWHYHWYPAAALGGFALAVSLRPRRAVLVIGVAAIVVGAWNLGTAWTVQAQPASAVAKVLTQISDHRPVLVLSTRSRVAFPAIEQLGLESDSPYPFLWMLQSNSPDSALAARVRTGIGRLVALHPPGVIVTDDTARGSYSTDFFRGNPDIAAVLDRCRPVASLDSLQFCRVRSSADGRVGQTPRS